MSYFPILVEWQDTKDREVVKDPKHLDNARPFKVIETNTKQ